MAGNVDGVMARMPISYGAYYQGWQPNRFMRLENIGDTDVVNPTPRRRDGMNPWITVNDAQVISGLWRAACLKTRRGYPVGHAVAEVFYDSEYHLLDGDEPRPSQTGRGEHAIYLRPNNQTIASEAEVVRDHDPVKRTHTYGIDRPDSRATDEFSASLYRDSQPKPEQQSGFGCGCQARAHLWFCSMRAL